MVLLGELALDGRVRGVRGVLPALLAARRLGVERVVVPAAAAVEAGLVEGLEVFGAEHLSDVLAWLRGEHGDAGRGPGAARGPAAAPRRTTSPTSSGSSRPAARWRSRRPGATTC